VNSSYNILKKKEDKILKKKVRTQKQKGTMVNDNMKNQGSKDKFQRALDVRCQRSDAFRVGSVASGGRVTDCYSP
jgi:hypothetical protein